MGDMSDRERLILSEWTRSMIDAAVYAGHIALPWRPTDRQYGALHACYEAGLTPEDGAEVLFAQRH